MNLFSNMLMNKHSSMGELLVAKNLWNSQIQERTKDSARNAKGIDIKIKVKALDNMLPPQKIYKSTKYSKKRLGKIKRPSKEEVLVINKRFAGISNHSSFKPSRSKLPKIYVQANIANLLNPVRYLFQSLNYTRNNMQFCSLPTTHRQTLENTQDEINIPQKNLLTLLPSKKLVLPELLPDFSAKKRKQCIIRAMNSSTIEGLLKNSMKIPNKITKITKINKEKPGVVIPVKPTEQKNREPIFITKKNSSFIPSTSSCKYLKKEDDEWKLSPWETRNGFFNADIQEELYN